MFSLLPRILVITDRSQASRPLFQVMDEVFAAGCRFASLREKDLSTDERRALLKDVCRHARAWTAKLLVHGDLGAIELCDGLHLPAGADLREVKPYMEDFLIGLSCHTVEEVKRAQDAGVHYVTLGPAAPTPSKPGYEPTLGLSDFEAAARLDYPVYALGGVDETNMRALRETGIWGIAGMGTFMRAASPGEVFRRWAEAWGLVR